MSKQRQIKSVNNSSEKQLTYREIKAKYNDAMESGFLLEALLIVYAMIEDRLLAFLYHSGVQKNRSCLDIPEHIKEQVMAIIRITKISNKPINIDLKTISGKSKTIQYLLRWASETEGETTSNYLKALRFQYESLDTAWFMENLVSLKRWLPYRNEVVHSLLNKNIRALYLELEEKVREGKKMADCFDSQVRIVKKGEYIRREAGL